jgi:uncharacterized membrane protein YecN with MAPEG domain
MPVITAFYAALTALLCVVLADLVIRQRALRRVNIGDGGDPALTRAVRVFGNFTEYAALAIVLLALAELLGVSKTWLHVYGAVFVVGRVAHAVGLSLTPNASPGRFIGIAATHLVLVGLAISLLMAVWPKL